MNSVLRRPPQTPWFLMRFAGGVVCGISHQADGLLDPGQLLEAVGKAQLTFSHLDQLAVWVDAETAGNVEDSGLLVISRPVYLSAAGGAGEDK